MPRRVYPAIYPEFRSCETLREETPHPARYSRHPLPGERLKSISVVTSRDPDGREFSELDNWCIVAGWQSEIQNPGSIRGGSRILLPR